MAEALKKNIFQEYLVLKNCQSSISGGQISTIIFYSNIIENYGEIIIKTFYNTKFPIILWRLENFLEFSLNQDYFNWKNAIEISFPVKKILKTFCKY